MSLSNYSLEVDDWTAIMCEFENGATGVFEGSTLMKGHFNNGFGFEWLEVHFPFFNSVVDTFSLKFILFSSQLIYKG